MIFQRKTASFWIIGVLFVLPILFGITTSSSAQGELGKPTPTIVPQSPGENEKSSDSLENTTPPTVDWVAPVGNGEVYSATSGSVWLEATASDNEAVLGVQFTRWDAVNLTNVTIGEDLSPPYQNLLNIDSLNYEWNEVRAESFDYSGNSSGRKHIWIYRLLPDLEPFQRDGYQYPVVPSSVQGTQTTNTLYTGEDTFYDWYFTNSGPGSVSGDFHVELWVDDVRYIRYPFSDFGINWVSGFDDWRIGMDISEGWHTVKLKVDPDNTIPESDESNNEWEYEFYWHDRCDGPGTPLPLDPEEGERTNNPRPTFTWTAENGADEYDLDIQGNTNLFVTTMTNSYTPNTDLAEGRYEWLVRGRDTTGSCNENGSWSDDWLFFIDLTPPDAPNLLEPSNGATISDPTPQFRWSSVTDAVEYEFELDNNSNFSSPITTRKQTGTSYTYSSPLNDGTYHWRVRARDDVGNWSGWRVGSFTINTCQTPGGVSLLEPSGLINDDTPFFDWTSASDATAYHLVVDDSSSFSSPVIDELVTSSSYQAGHLNDDVYYWRVRAYNGSGNCNHYGGWSSSASFEIDITPPSVPTLFSPSNGEQTNDNTPFFDWGNVSGAVEYRIQVDNNSNFSSPAINQPRTSSSYSSSSALSDGLYYWRVQARDEAGNWSGWSPVWTVTIDIVPPSTPTLLTPGNGANLSDPIPFLDWSAPSGATQYHLQVGNNSNFSSPIVDQIFSSSNHTLASALADNTTYYWRVRAGDAAGNWSEWTGTWQFTILPACYQLTLQFSGSGSAPTYSPSNSSNCDELEYHAGTDVTLTARPANGWLVERWGGTNNDSSNDSTNVVTMPASNHTATAYYVVQPTVQFAAASFSESEAGGNATIEVRRSGYAGHPLMVNYATSNGTATAGSDYSARSGTLTFAANDVSETFTVPIINDNVHDPAETVNLTLSSPTNASLGTTATATLTIDDNESIPTVRLATPEYLVNEGAGDLRVDVVLSHASNNNVTVAYQTVGETAVSGSDYTPRNGTLTFSPGQTSRFITIPIIDDALDEDKETFAIRISGPNGAGLGSPNEAEIVIDDDDTICYVLAVGSLPTRAIPEATPPNSPECPLGQYRAGTAVQLEAQPHPKWRVARWSGSSDDNSIDHDNSVMMPAQNHQVMIHYRWVGGDVEVHLPVAGRNFMLPYLSPTETEPNDSIPQANGPIRSDRLYKGAFLNREDTKDYFMILLKEAGRIRVTLANVPPGHDYNLAVRNQSAAIVDGGYSANAGDDFVETAVLPPGRYYIQVFNYSGPGTPQPYHLTAVFD